MFKFVFIRHGVSEWSNLIFVLRTTNWAYIWNPTGIWPTDTRYQGGEYPVEEEELYNIKIDPKQKTNLIHRSREVADTLKVELLNWRTSVLDENQLPVGVKVREKPKLTKEMEDALKSLGYVDDI